MTEVGALVGSAGVGSGLATIPGGTGFRLPVVAGRVGLWWNKVPSKENFRSLGQG